jgi:Mg2+/citrate symporter
MSYLLTIFLASVTGLAGYNAYVFLTTKGAVLERLAASWKNSLTIFTLVWGGIASLFVVAGSDVAQFAGDPQFQALADKVDAILPQQYHPYLAVVVAVLGILSRMRTLGK